MANWGDFSAAEPDLAAAVRERFDAHGHKTLATVRLDGSPRISGTEVRFLDGEMWLGGMPGSRKCLDMQRDPRIAIHSASEDPDVWTGDAKVAGVAVEVIDDAVLARFRGASGEVPPGPFHLFRVDLREAVLVRLAPAKDHLEIEMWHEGVGRRRVERR